MQALSHSILVLALALSGCVSTRMYLAPVDLKRLDAPRSNPSDMSIALQPVPRMESSLYQAAFEQELARTLRHSGLFKKVALGDFDPGQIDLILEAGRANLTSRSQLNLAYFRLALVTATLYVWVGDDVGVHARASRSQSHAALTGARMLLRLLCARAAKWALGIRKGRFEWRLECELEST